MDISDEENEARAGFYHLASDTAFGNLIRFALDEDADALSHSMVLIVLDWTKPWEFLTTLETWLGVLEREIAKRTQGKQGLSEELQEKYATAALVRDLGYKEEEFDFIQQTLRTICLKYTSIAHAAVKSPYGPGRKPQVVERDNVFVPAGWDSWGKINILRTGFDCAAIANDADLNGNDAHETSPATEIYQSVITVPPVQKLYTSEPVVVAENEQTFLERHQDLLQNATGSPGPSSSSDPSRGAKTPTSPSPAPSDELRPSKIGKSKDPASTSNREKLKSPSSADFPLPASLISSNAVSRAAGAIGANAGAAVGGTGAGGVSATQNEVLANFFQSLLQKKAPAPGPGGAPVGTSSNTSPRSVSVVEARKPGAGVDHNSDEKKA
ncbi:Cytoplasmic dynein 1 light intermediate chain 2 [Geranomyces variabilis]|uniref:Cytoplasmic dynein 1 light intermediate chain 2 n=1 Tax=Geranomyces variabilis TaxID=109894 RepID=A0AAD5XPY2_9FUNG|nr:Cytoplasmic dynein 1 light intermediate chain 2 [Geranomyces variabilis]